MKGVCWSQRAKLGRLGLGLERSRAQLGLAPTILHALAGRRSVRHSQSPAAARLLVPPPQVHDRMTEQVYPEPLRSFATDAVPAPVTTIPVLAQGRAALEKINKVGSGCARMGP